MPMVLEQDAQHAYRDVIVRYPHTFGHIVYQGGEAGPSHLTLGQIASGSRYKYRRLFNYCVNRIGMICFGVV